MAYQFTNAARECRLFKGNGQHTVRLTLMTLASSADNKDYTCRPSYNCLMHWTGCNKATLMKALRAIEKAGIITRTKRPFTSSIYKFNLNVLESLREPFRNRETEEQPCEHSWPSNPSRAQICFICGADKSDLPDADPKSGFELDEEFSEAEPTRGFEVEEIEEDDTEADSDQSWRY